MAASAGEFGRLPPVQFDGAANAGLGEMAGVIQTGRGGGDQRLRTVKGRQIHVIVTIMRDQQQIDGGKCDIGPAAARASGRRRTPDYNAPTRSDRSGYKYRQAAPGRSNDR